MLRPARPKVCCLVVGMHNSGTSLVGALLHAAGVPMGKQLLLREAIAPEKRPRYDYFEDQDVVALQDAALLQLKRHWSSYRGSFAMPDADSEARQDFRRQLGGLLRQRLKRERLWVVKDPRTAVLLSDWMMVLQEQKVQLKLLIVHRDAASNIGSFSSKGQVPPLWAEALWQRTYTNALRVAQTLQDSEVWRVSFAELMADPGAQVRGICDFLHWTPRKDLTQQVAARFDPSLPTHNTVTGHPKGLHSITLKLEQQLRCPQPSVPEEHQLLAAELSEALQPNDDQLNLNNLHPDGQSLLPKLRVTVVTAELQGWGPSGGIGSAYLELATALAAAGHPVRILLVCEGDLHPERNLSGVHVERLNPTGLSRIELCRQVAERLQQDPGDVIHMHDWLGLGSGLKAALGADCPPLIVGLHGPSAWTRCGNPWPERVETELIYDEGVVQALEQDTLAQADLLVAPSRYMSDWVKQHFSLRNRTLVQRNCPLSTDRVAVRPGFKGERLVYFGRLEQRKGLLLFLDALEQLPALPPEVVFVGSDCRIDTEHWGSEFARKRLASRGIDIRFATGLKRTEALELLRELAGVVVIPSLIENSPCVVEELLDSGMRLVTTMVGGTPELVKKTCHCWLSAPEPLAMAKHLQQALYPRRPGDYLLEASLPPWLITLSWQAFHERLPRHQNTTSTTVNQQTSGASENKGFKLIRRVSRKLFNLPVNRNDA